MGQAKLRGSRDDRVRQVKAREAVDESIRELLWKQYRRHAARRVERRDIGPFLRTEPHVPLGRRIALISAIAAAGLLAAPIPPKSRKP